MSKLPFNLTLALLFCVFSNTSYSYDVFGVYDTKVAQDCIEKNITEDKLSLIDLVKLGICNNPDLSADYYSIVEAEADLGSAKSEYFPSVDLSGGLSSSNTRYDNNEGSNNDNPYNINLGLSMLLYDFGGRSARVDSFKSYLNSVKFSYNSALQDLILSINTSYFKVLGAKENLRSSLINEEMYKKTYDVANKKYNVGLVSLNDKLQAQTNYEESKLSVIENKNYIKIYEGELAILLNLSPNTSLNLENFLDDKEQKLKTTKQTVESLLELALKERDEIKVQEEAINSANSSIKELRASRYGSFSLSASSGYNNSWNNDYYYTKDNVIGLTYSVPLFAGFDTSYKISAAKQAKRQAKYSLMSTKNTIQNEVWSAYNNYESSTMSYETSKAVLKSAIENQKVAFSSYELGHTDILNLLTAEAQLADAREQVNYTYYTVLINKATLYRSIGRF